MISIILPTFNEAGNIGRMVERISTVMGTAGYEWEIIVVDDNSPDGTADEARALAPDYPVRVHERRNERGLASAVMTGFELARGEICVVMDADMSHPVEKIADLVGPIEAGECDATVGSRYLPGGGCEDWPLTRRLTSKGAGLLARGLVSISDPTTGFMAIRKTMLHEVRLDPVGWKIVLEVLVRTDARCREVPIVFAGRRLGASKLNLQAQQDYLHHLGKLYCHRYPTVAEFVKFCLVGLSGILLDTAVLVGCVELGGLDPRFAAAFAFLAAVTWNYALNRVWTFGLTPGARIARSYLAFVLICIVGFGVRLGVMHVLIEYAGMGVKPWYIAASVIGIVAGTIANFLGSKYVAFAATLARPTR